VRAQGRRSPAGVRLTVRVGFRMGEKIIFCWLSREREKKPTHPHIHTLLSMWL